MFITERLLSVSLLPNTDLVPGLPFQEKKMHQQKSMEGSDTQFV